MTEEKKPTSIWDKNITRSKKMKSPISVNKNKIGFKKPGK